MAEIQEFEFGALRQEIRKSARRAAADMKVSISPHAIDQLLKPGPSFARQELYRIDTDELYENIISILRDSVDIFRNRELRFRRTGRIGGVISREMITFTLQKRNCHYLWWC